MTLTNDILEQILENDGAGFNLLISEYDGLVKAIARSYLSNPADVDEVTSDVWLKVFEKRYMLKSVEKFPGWICKVVRNTCLNLLKAKKRYSKHHYLTGFPARYEAVAAFAGNDCQRVFEIKELKSFVDRVFGIMNELYRVPLHLFYREDMSVKEIGRLLCINESTVKWRLHQGRILFRKEASRLMLFRKESCKWNGSKSSKCSER